MTSPVFRIQQLTCAACGYRLRCRIRTHGEVEIMPNCESCGRCDCWEGVARMDASPQAALTAGDGGAGAAARSGERQMVVLARSYER